MVQGSFSLQPNFLTTEITEKNQRPQRIFFTMKNMKKHEE